MLGCCGDVIRLCTKLPNAALVDDISQSIIGGQVAQRLLSLATEVAAWECSISSLFLLL